MQRIESRNDYLCARNRKARNLAMTTEELLKWDRTHLWHPYTSTIHPQQTYPVASAKGCVITLEDGRELIDGMSSWWCAIHGYSHPALTRAITEQAEELAHIMFGGFTHRPAVELGQLLVDQILPEGIDRLFYSDSGSVSVEVALKMAIQYQLARGRAGHTHFATISRGYHGDTWHAMSVCDPITSMHSLFYGTLPVQYFAPQPACAFGDEWDPEDLRPMQELVERHRDHLAGIIVEPIVQGAGGMYFYHPKYLEGLRALCDEYDLLLIFDEIATGFGRTGELLATYFTSIKPDILTIGKAMTGGYMTLACTATTQEIADTICSGEAGCFMHGPTFMANPMACAVSKASIELLLSHDWRGKVSNIENQLREGLSPLQELSDVREVRCLGAIGVVEISEPVDMEQLIPRFVEEGIWVRPFGKLIYLEPQFMAITDEQLDSLIGGLSRVLRACYR